MYIMLAINPVGDNNIFAGLYQKQCHTTDQMWLKRFVLEMMENIVGKGENSGDQHFFLKDYLHCITVIKSCNCMVNG